jgi:hypothetical protein
MRFLLDTNVLIPLEDSKVVLAPSLANFIRLANQYGHELLYHPASEDDIRQDADLQRRGQTLLRLRQYTRLDARPECPWNSKNTSRNDAADNEILYALLLNAAHALVTEDQGIHSAAKSRGLVHLVYTIQTAEDQLRRLHERISLQLPNIEDVPLYSLTPRLNDPFFDSLRAAYPFNDWFQRKARDGRRAWVNWERPGVLGGLCIFTRQQDERVTDSLTLRGPALKLATFKVGETNRGRKVGELFLKAAFRYASGNQLEHIFIHGDERDHAFLFEMLEDFGFTCVGTHPGSNGRDAVYVKAHPTVAPADPLPPFEYLRRYFPHFRHEEPIGKFVIPIQPTFHRILFPDYISPADRQMELLNPANTAGNAIKLAYLCHAQTRRIEPGDVLLFYRSGDERAVTTVGVAESYETLADPAQIVARVKRRTVYSMQEISDLAVRPTRVLLFRLVQHLEHPLSQAWLEREQVLRGAPQSITRVSHEGFERVLTHGF